MRRLLLSACALRFLDTFLLIVPFYTVMFAEKGLSPAQIGLVLGAWSATGLLLEIPCGVLADRMSRRWLLAISQLLRAAGFLVWLAFPGFWGFLIGLTLWGMKSATMSGAFEAVVYDELKALGREAEYAKVFGRAKAARGVGLVAASLTAAVAAPLGYGPLIVASAIAGVAAAGAALLLPSAPRAVTVADWGYLSHLRRGAREAISLPGIPALILFIAGVQAVAYATADYWQLFGRDVGLAKPAIALFIAAMATAEAIGSVLSHRIGRLDPRWLYAVTCVGGLSIVAAAGTFQAWSVIFPLAYMGLYSLVDVSADARFHHALRGETRATVASLKGFATQCANGVLILGFGLLAQASAYRISFLTYGAGLTLLGAIYATASLRRR
ncbi:MAG: MFS transporter [Alphaproteobacteria bacterium]|nr:MFS transporter [Alphaproteobacteria bacterium]MBU1515557.1 MFS transporter [Alphaproteobacteria bacterium]MBU2095555.1 MFS transporter [Alphaproteobacteria bacterium]MBU2150796.1 MFS transporter [Alphaproteobacteria bacterium]MBU2307061.1 MFS transporter [Alphaproteobacteria bacterium]